MGFSLGSLFIELAANTARLQSDLGKAVGYVEGAASKFKSAFKFAGAGLLGAAFAQAVKQSIEFGDNINKAAIKAGIGGRAMSELAYAAKLADIDIASLSTGLKKMQVSLSEAGTGAKEPKEALTALGLTVEQLQKRKPEAQFELLADRISKLADPADRARAAVTLFGKAGADLLPLFAEGAAGIAKARAEAEKLGLSFSDGQIKALSEADDSIKRLDASWKGFATTLTAYVAPGLSTVLDQLAGIDTRSLAQKITDTQDALKPRRNQLASERARLQQQLGNLQGLQNLQDLRSSQTGSSGGPQSRGQDGLAIGYAAADAAAKAEAAAKAAAAAELKERTKFNAAYADLVSDLNREVGAEADKTLQADMGREVDRLDAARDYYDTVLDNEKKLAIFRETQNAKLSEGAQIWKDAFLNAWDDMVNRGKLRIDELLKYAAAEFARRGLVKLFDGAFSGAKSSSSGGGWLSTIGSFVGSLFSGKSSIEGKASGGDVAGGRMYKIGEKGEELFLSKGGGTIVPNHQLGGHLSMTFAPQYHISTTDTAALPRILQENNRRFLDDLDRRGLLTRAAA